MEDSNALIEQRKSNLAALRAGGMDPFRNKFTPGDGCGEARAKYEAGTYAEGQPVALAGRITAHRDMGKSQFMDLKDQSGRIQIYVQQKAVGEDAFALFKQLDLADFIGVRGTMFQTRAGEISVKVEEFVPLTKALRPPPAKWHGLEDTETRYRQRYLDLMSNDQVKETFVKRSAILREIRNFLHERGYLEVETPMMQAIPGGAAARPFVTHHNSLGCDFYLRIALELALKRLLVGGFDKVFEMGRNFRNEGLSRRHNPEFTMLEAYQAYGDYESMMELVESLVCHVAEKVLGTLEIPRNRATELSRALGLCGIELHEARVSVRKAHPTPAEEQALMAWLEPEQEHLRSLSDHPGSRPYWEVAQEAVRIVDSAESKLFGREALDSGLFQDFAPLVQQAKGCLARAREKLGELVEEEDTRTINLTRPWRRVRYKDLVRERAGADWFDVSPEARKARAVELGAELGDAFEDFEVTQAVFEKLIEPTLIDPVFVTHAAKELIPLAKLSPDDPTTVEVFECCLNGQEIAPGYTEQNDPIEQRERLEHQAGGEQQKLDEDFLVALEHGMPPAGGIGIGIDRLCMLLLGQESIRDVLLFPQLRPK